MERGEARMAPNSLVGWWVAGDVMGHLQRNGFLRWGGAGNGEIHLHLFSEEGYVSPNTQSSDGKELVVSTCSRV